MFHLIVLLFCDDTDSSVSCIQGNMVGSQCLMGHNLKQYTMCDAHCVYHLRMHTVCAIAIWSYCLCLLSADYMYDIRFALDGAITCRVYQAGYLQAAYWDPGTPSSLSHLISSYSIALLCFCCISLQKILLLV